MMTTTTTAHHVNTGNNNQTHPLLQAFGVLGAQTGLDLHTASQTPK
jgi:hypothetical protein